MNLNKDVLTEELMNLMVDAVNFEDLSNRIVRFFSHIFKSEFCTFWNRVVEKDQEFLILSASSGLVIKPGEIIPRYELNWTAFRNEEIEGITPWIAIRNKFCIANSFQELAVDATKPWFGSHRGIWDTTIRMGRDFKSLMGFPIYYERNELLGVIKIENNPSGFSRDDYLIAKALIPFVSICLKSMMRFEQAEKNRQIVLKNLTIYLMKTDLTTFHQQAVDKTAELLRADSCSLWLITNDNKKLVLAANYGVRDKDQVPEYSLNWNAKNDEEIDGLTPWVIIRKKTFFAGKYEDLKRCGAHRGKWDHEQWDGKPSEKFGCLYAVPLLKEDQPIGVLKIENSRGKPIFDDVDKATFDIVADFIALAIELNTSLRSHMGANFFHLLIQPTSSAISAFNALRYEFNQLGHKSNTIDDYLDMMARNLEILHLWALNIYGLSKIPITFKDEPLLSVNLYKMINSVNRNMEKLFPYYKCNVSSSLQYNDVKLTELQKKKVEVIFHNILNNSYKYSENEININVTSATEKDHLVILIEDKGRGIKKGQLPNIFEAYFSTHSDKWPESMGLGLYTVSRLLRDLGWFPKVESEFGKGTKFYIYIPKIYQL